MRIYRLAGWLALAGLFALLGTLRYEPVPVVHAVDLPAVYAALDTTTYGDARIVYKLSTDTLRNSAGDLRRLPDLSAAPTGSRWRVIWKPSTFDSVMLVTGDTFALSPMDSADATALATSWGVTDPHTVTLAWHVPPGAAPDPLENVAVVAVHDTLRTSWTSVTDSVRIFSGLDAGGEEDTFYVAGTATPHDRVVTAEGDYFSCGNAYTTQAEADYAANRCGSATIDTTEPGGGEDFPNEPAGFTTIAHVDFTDSINAQVGDCGFPTGESPNKTFVTNDGSAPTGDLSVIRLRYPDGEGDGGSNGRRFDCWGPTRDPGGASNDYAELYVSYWLKVEGSDFQNQSTGTKTHYVAHGSTIRFNHSVPFLDGSFSGQTVQTSMSYAPYIYEMEDDGSDAGGGSVRRNPNICGTGSSRVQVGEWTQIEIHYQINDINPTTDNGRWRHWINGVLCHDETGIRWRSTENPKGFYHLQFTPVYGGNAGDVRTRDDFWRIDELYISAKSF